METVFLARRERGGYEAGAARQMLGRLFAIAAVEGFEPLGAGDRVLIKPNWVYHENRSGGGMECLVTHPSLIAAILEFALAARPSSVVVGDAPVQGCDFAELLRNIRLSEWVSDRIEIRDFRAITREGGGFAARSSRSRRNAGDYIEFDLGAASALEPITDSRTEFRVTMYDPDALKKTHRPGMHCYLVAREAIEADTVFSIAKLKTHRKAGITGALKNVVGINGLKDYLPHHRKGSAEEGGDCYAASSALKSVAEACLDAGNRPYRNRHLSAALAGVAGFSAWLAGATGADPNLEGGWHGNDTVWRMTLDLQRILRFGRLDGSVANSPQRRVIHVTDAIVAGEGEGPLFPSPVPLGVITLSEDAGAADWVHALLMGFDPARIPLVKNACAGESAVSICQDGRWMRCEALEQCEWPAFRPPAGWRGFVERARGRECAAQGR